jgi:hypothetical protein
MLRASLEVSRYRAHAPRALALRERKVQIGKVLLTAEQKSVISLCLPVWQFRPIIEFTNMPHVLARSHKKKQ